MGLVPLLLPVVAVAAAALLLMTGRGGAGGVAVAAPAIRRWPVSIYRGAISAFGARRTRADGSARFHAGIDLGAFVGDTILAIDDGEVVSMVSGYSLGAGLEAVSVRHPDSCARAT